MKIFILGHGAVGSVLSKLLSKEKSVDHIICGDINFKEEKHVGRIHHIKVDLKNKTRLLEIFNESKPDLVINVTLPKFNKDIMETCIKAKTNYLDTASFWELRPEEDIPYDMEQLAYYSEFKRNNITGLICSGVAPGLDNLITAECASHFDEIDYIKIRMVEDTGSKEIFFAWNKEWLLDELNSPPLVYENGKFRLEESFGAEEEFDFPKPIGKRKTYYFAQDEVGSIPLYIKTKKMDVKIHDNNIDVSRLLVKLGLTSNHLIDVGGAKIKPIQMLSKLLPDPVPGEEKKFPESVFGFTVEITGKSAKKKKTKSYSVIFPKQKEIERLGIGANFISYPTALSVMLFATAFPFINKKGVFPPESLDKEAREVIMKNLKKYVKVIVK